MERTTISGLAAFESERERWEDLYRSDPQAQLFLSWAWLHAAFPQLPHRWTIAVLRKNDRLIAALPLSTRAVPHRLLPIARELRFATDPFADYHGMLCRPGFEDAAIAAFTKTLLELRWEKAVFADVSDARVTQMLAPLRDQGIVLAEDEPARCFAIELPETYEAFLQRLSKPTRRRTTTPLKVLPAELPALRITTSDEPGADLPAHVDAIIDLNTKRWSASSRRAVRLRGLLLAAHDEGVLRVHAIWDGTRPIAAGAVFRDPVHGVQGFYLVAHDSEYDRFGPGKGILALVVQTAIAEQYAVVDFMRGDEEYKQSYATREHANRRYTATRPCLREKLLTALGPLLEALRTLVLRLRERRAS